MFEVGEDVRYVGEEHRDRTSPPKGTVGVVVNVDFISRGYVDVKWQNGTAGIRNGVLACWIDEIELVSDQFLGDENDLLDEFLSLYYGGVIHGKY